MILCALLAMLVGACAAESVDTSAQQGQVETVAPAGTSTVEQMEIYDKSQPPSGEKRIMPMPGATPEQHIDALPRRESESGDMR